MEFEALLKLTEGVDAIYRYSISIGGILAFGIIIFAGIEYIISAGNVARQQDAKSRIFNAILGLIILLGAVLITRGVPGLLTFTEENFITPEPPSTSPAFEAAVKEAQKAKAEATAALDKIEEVAKQKLDVAGSDPEKLKVAFFDMQATYTQSTYGYKALGVFFEEIQKRGLDDELFFSFKTAAEKAKYLRTLFNGNVPLLEPLRNVRGKLTAEEIYDVFLETPDLVTLGYRNEFINSLLPSSLSAVFTTFYQPGSVAMQDFVGGLDDTRIIRLYENLPSGQFRTNFLTILQNLGKKEIASILKNLPPK